MIDNRDNKKENAQEKNFPKVHVNWYSTNYLFFNLRNLIKMEVNICQIK